MRAADRRRIERRLAAIRQEADDLAALLAAEAALEQRTAELADARAYADRLEKVLALHRFALCLGWQGDRCHHRGGEDPPTAPMPVIPAQRQPSIGELIGRTAKERGLGPAVRRSD